MALLSDMFMASTVRGSLVRHANSIMDLVESRVTSSLDSVEWAHDSFAEQMRLDVLAGDDARRARLAAVMARTGAGTAQMAARLPATEVANLLSTLASTASPSFTPQGKPVMVEITLDDIKNKMR
jgi:DNA mismatch repair ATPase MutL